MKFENKVRALASVAGALVLVLAASLALGPRYDRSGKVAMRLLESISASEVGMIEVAGRAALVLERQGNSWFVKGGASKYPAKVDRVQDFLTKAFDIAEMAYVGTGSEAWEGFGLSPSSAARVTVKTLSGTVVGDFYAGSRDLLNQGVYVRLEGSEESYVAPSGFSTYLESYALAPAQWEDARVLPGIDAQSVARVSLKGRLERSAPSEGQDPNVEVDYILESKNGSWVARGIDGMEIDAEKVKTYLSSLGSYSADEYVEPSDEQGLSSPALTLTVGYFETINFFTGARSAQPDTVIDIAKGKDGSYYLSARGKGYVLKTTLYGVSQIAKEIDYFKKVASTASPTP